MIRKNLEAILLFLAFIILNFILIYDIANGEEHSTIETFLKENKLTTTDKYFEWVFFNITYTSDEVDYAQLPEETIQRKKGDCEDFAILNQAVLKHFGVYSKFFVVHSNRGSGHAIIMFWENNQISYTSNETKYETGTSSIQEFIEYLNSKGYNIKGAY